MTTTTLTANSRHVFPRYFQPDEDDADAVFQRVATAIALGQPSHLQEEYTKCYLELLSSLKFLPNSPTLKNAGTGRGCLSGCFVMSPEDTMPSILQVHYDAGLAEKWGGGIGFGFSKLRPGGDKISTTHGHALGVLGVLRMYSLLGKEITQGVFRRGAHMGQLSISHPQVQEFIRCKEDGVTAQNFNISVQVTDEFMRAVDNDGPWDLINPHDGEVWLQVRARALWEEICTAAWTTGDPGLAFMDRVWETAPNPQLGAIESFNPCGEEALENYGSCNLGSINLNLHVKDGEIDWTELGHTIRLSVRFLNDVITVNEFPPEVPRLRESNLSIRRIGLGVMGWADMLVGLGLAYDSSDAVSLAGRLSRFITNTAWEESHRIAMRDGPFPEWENSALSDRLPVRNSNVTTIAPTGSISILAGCSSGIEPFYGLVNRRKVLWQSDGTSTMITEAVSQLRQELTVNCGELAALVVLGQVLAQPDRAAEILTRNGIDARLYKSAHDIAPAWHLRHQAAWQSGTTNGVSKTVNMPHDATPKDVSDVYMEAWRLKCKGVTIYRNGSKDEQVLDTGLCPTCGGELAFEEGCATCKACGWGACGVQ